ncbi:MAG: HTH-type transcriptional regulator/antitoxin MqsA [Phenylobacterium sp.]|jgi:HTH-type transcriptional regulator/antitoxin MqsA
MNECKYCQSENIDHLSSQEIILYKGGELDIVIDYSVCCHCKREFISKQQILNNDTRLRDAKKIADGLLTSTEIYNARVSLDLTQEQASLVFGGGRNAFSKYERAEVSQSIAMDKLIRTCLRHPNVFKELLAEAGLKSK